MLMKDEGDEHYISASEQACVESSLIKSGPRWLKLHTTHYNRTARAANC